MLSLDRRRVFLCRKPVDMRKAFDSLADVVRLELGMDPFNGDVFVFIGKDRTRAKVLMWEPSGFWLCAKRLETACFRCRSGEPKDGRVDAAAEQSPQVAALLDEVMPRAAAFARETCNKVAYRPYP